MELELKAADVLEALQQQPLPQSALFALEELLGLQMALLLLHQDLLRRLQKMGLRQGFVTGFGLVRRKNHLEPLQEQLAGELIFGIGTYKLPYHRTQLWLQWTLEGCLRRRRQPLLQAQSQDVVLGRCQSR